MKKLLSLIVLSSVAVGLHAAQLTPDQALDRLRTSTNVGARVKGIKNVEPVMAVKATADKNFTSLYIFNNNPAGYIIVSADDCAVPLLGYSETEAFDTQNIPSQLRWWLDFYANEINYAATHPSVSRAAAARPNRDAISPLLTTLWNQSAPYNNDCPMYGSSRSVTGCVATAMAQAMKYYNWPPKGTGSGSATCNGESYTLDFSTVTFDWANMTDTYSSSSTAAQNAAVAQLMYACGVSVGMTYTSSESGASSLNIAPALYSNFGYSGAMVQPDRAFYGLIDWENMVYNELANKRPVLYGGQSNDGGHQFVCDGYSSDGYFHFNWGWAGQSDGYYLLSALDPMTQGIGGSTTGFNYDQGIVINMVPSTDTSVTASPLIYCYGDFELSSTSDTGSFRLGNPLSFTSSRAFYNFGCKDESGRKGIKVVSSDGRTVNYYGDNSVSGLSPSYGYGTYNATISSSLPNGTYTVTPAFLPNGSSKWVDVLAPLSGVRALTMTVSNGYATFSDAPGAQLSVSGFKLNSTLYLDTNFKATMTLSNVGSAEYYGQLSMALLDSDGNLVDQTQSALAVDIEAGESTTADFIGSFASRVSTSTGVMQVPAGSYTLVVFDIMTGSVVYVYPTTVQVQAAPSSTSLTVSNFALANGVNGEVSNPSDIRFTGTVRCSSGYFGNQLKVAIFPEGATSTSIISSTEFLFLSAGQSSTFSATVDLTGAESGARYFAAVFSPTNTQLTNGLYFTINDQAGIEDARIEDNSDIRYYNLQGVEVSADNLTPGIYIMRKGTTTTKIRL